MNIQTGVIGASGYWGQRVLKALSAIPNVEIVACAAKSDNSKLTKTLDAYGSRWSPLKSLDYKTVLDQPNIKAVIVCAPAEYHHEIVGEALLKGKEVFVEKPLCLNLRNALELKNFAKENERILFVDHTYLFSESLPFIKSEIRNMQGIRSFHSHRTQLGIYRNYGVLWDLGPHDLSIIKYLFDILNDEIESIHATKMSNLRVSNSYDSQPITDTVFFRMSYKRGLTFSAFLSCCYPKSVREITIAGENKFIFFEKNRHVSVFKHNLLSNSAIETLNDSPQGCCLLKKKEDNSDHLKNALSSFFHCVDQNLPLPLGSSPDFACEIIELLERIQSAMIQCS